MPQETQILITLLIARILHLSQCQSFGIYRTHSLFHTTAIQTLHCSSNCSLGRCWTNVYLENIGDLVILTNSISSTPVITSIPPFRTGFRFGTVLFIPPLRTIRVSVTHKHGRDALMTTHEHIVVSGALTRF